VVATLNGLGPVAVQVRQVTTETVHFALPREARNR
jgi:hypothetical protein